MDENDPDHHRRNDGVFQDVKDGRFAIKRRNVK